LNGGRKKIIKEDPGCEIVGLGHNEWKKRKNASETRRSLPRALEVG